MFKTILITCLITFSKCFGDKTYYYNLLNKKVYLAEKGQESNTFLLVVPPIYAENYITPERTTEKYFCKPEAFSCIVPYSKKISETYKCDNLCPKNYVCCRHYCFTNKVCLYKKFSYTIPESTRSTGSSTPREPDDIFFQIITRRTTAKSTKAPKTTTSTTTTEKTTIEKSSTTETPITTTQTSITTEIPTTTIEISTTTELPTTTIEISTTTELPTTTIELSTTTEMSTTSTIERSTITELPTTTEISTTSTIETSTTTELSTTTTEIPTTTEISTTSTIEISTTTELPTTTIEISTTTDIPTISTIDTSTTTEISTTTETTRITGTSTTLKVSTTTEENLICSSNFFCNNGTLDSMDDMVCEIKSECADKLECCSHHCFSHKVCHYVNVTESTILPTVNSE